MTPFEQKVCSQINKIPPGKVATYGQIAALVESPRSALAVGRILRTSALNLQWQRVINSQGRISIQNIEYPAVLQKQLLEQEGVEVIEKNNSFYVDLSKYLWKP